MITAAEIQEFEGAIQTKWGRRGIDPQELVSTALERYERKRNVETIRHPVRWLLRAAVLIRRELYRDQKKRDNTIDAVKATKSPDRRMNGAIMHPQAMVVMREFNTVSARRKNCEIACSQVLQSLTTRERALAEHCGICGRTPAEAAPLIGSNRSTVKSGWLRLKKKLELNESLLNAVGGSRSAVQ